MHISLIFLSVFPKDKVIAALDKKSLTVEEKLIVLKRLGINPTEKAGTALLVKKETDQAINVISPSKQLMQKQSTHHKATSSHKKSKKVKKAIKYFNGKDVPKGEIEKALQTENFTKAEIEIVLSNV